MSEVQTSSNPLMVGGGPNVRNLAITMVIDAVLPLIVYELLTPRFPSGSVTPLLIATIFPTLGNVISIIRQRRLDYLGVVILIGIVCSILLAFITGNQKFLLIRESFLTLAYGFVCLGSLLFPRPIMFFIGRHFATGNDPAKITYYNALWQYPAFRSLNRLITIVWGVALLCEFSIRLILVYTLTVAQVLVISPIVTSVILIALIWWTIVVSKRGARRGEASRQQRLAAQRLPSNLQDERRQDIP